RDTAIPADARTFLDFNGYHVFDVGSDDDGNDLVLAGGVVEYSTDQGATWLDAGSLPAVNGYNGVIDPDWPNPLHGRPAFTLANGAAQPNLVTVGVGAGGKVSLFNNAGSVHLIGDVVGWFDNNGPTGRYRPTTPARLLDTRDGTGGRLGAVPGGTSIPLAVTGA